MFLFLVVFLNLAVVLSTIKLHIIDAQLIAMCGTGLKQNLNKLQKYGLFSLFSVLCHTDVLADNLTSPTSNE